MEEWKDILDFEGFYQISNFGNVKSLTRLNSRGYKLSEKILKQNNSKGYMIIDLSKEGRRYTKSIHRIVADAFIPNPNNLPDVNHKDGDKSNNHVDNLEWITERDNMIHAYENGLSSNQGETHAHSKLSNNEIDYIRSVYKPRDKEFGTRALGRRFNVDHKTISAIVNNKSYKRRF